MKPDVRRQIAVDCAVGRYAATFRQGTNPCRADGNSAGQTGNSRDAFERGGQTLPPARGRNPPPPRPLRHSTLGQIRLQARYPHGDMSEGVRAGSSPEAASCELSAALGHWGTRPLEHSPPLRLQPGSLG